MMEEKEILLNIMFNGSYLKDTNIGHEIINLFKADNGNNYIYVLPYGSMAKKHNNKIKTILLVKRHSSTKLEIIAKATQLEQVLAIQKSTFNKEHESIYNEQIEYIKTNNITYGSKKLYDIFATNNDNKFKPMYITFKAGNVLKTQKPIYITTDKNQETDECHYMQGIDKFPSQSPKMYISEKTKGFKDLQSIINDKTNWKKENTTNPISISDKSNCSTTQKHNFIDIIGKQYDELAFSNLFKYIFDSNPSACCKFVRDVLVEDINCDNDAFTIQREWKNIDLLLTNKKNVIVIENKIKSDINGKQDVGNGIVKSQLDKYQGIIDKEAKYNGYSKLFFIFAPDYNHIKLTDNDKYKIIKYSTIEKFFNDNKTIYKNTPYFQEFLYALSRHSKSVDNPYEEIMFQRFKNAIQEAKN